jgi:ankyrin repeat protein
LTRAARSSLHSPRHRHHCHRGITKSAPPRHYQQLTVTSRHYHLITTTSSPPLTSPLPRHQCHATITASSPQDIHYGATALSIAATNGTDAVVELLCGHPTTNVNQARTDDGNTPLLMCASYGHVKTAKVLLSHKSIKPNHANMKDGIYNGATALFMAVAYGFSGIVEELMQVNDIDVAFNATFNPL